MVLISNNTHRFYYIYFFSFFSSLDIKLTSLQRIKKTPSITNINYDDTNIFRKEKYEGKILFHYILYNNESCKGFLYSIQENKLSSYFVIHYT